jgi:hypothetical protein
MENWPRRKRVRTQNPKTASQQQSDDLVHATARLVTEVAAQQRVDRACVQRVALLPKECSISAAVLKAGQDYHEGKETAKAKDSMQLEADFPFVYVWQALILALIASEVPSAEEKKQLLAHSSTMTEPEQVLEHVRVCKAKITHTNDAVKLVICVDYFLQELASMIFVIFKRLGAIIKFGPAPPSTNERAVKNLLRQHSA